MDAENWKASTSELAHYSDGHCSDHWCLSRIRAERYMGAARKEKNIFPEVPWRLADERVENADSTPCGVQLGILSCYP